MSMSPEETQQSGTGAATTTTTTITVTATSDTATPTTEPRCSSSDQLRHEQKASSSLIQQHASSDKHRNFTQISCQAATTTARSSLEHLQQQSNQTMAMHNFGPNALQHEQQMKHQQQAGSGTDTSSWQNNNNLSNNNNNNTTTNAQGTGSEHTNDPQQQSTVVNNNDHKSTESSPPNQAPNRTLSRQQQQHNLHQQQLQSQSQQYHGIFSPRIPASFQSSLADRVDSIIRTTLDESPAYTPPTSKNNQLGNSNNALTSMPTSNNMPSPSSSSSLAFNSAIGSTSGNNPSGPQGIPGHPTNSNLGLVSTASSIAPPITSVYGTTLSSMSDNSVGNNLSAKTSPSHSALAAAAALQSLNQSHIQRSQQQQMAHTQPSPFLSATGPGLSSLSAGKSTSNGAPVPQAAHGASNLSNHLMPKSMVGPDPQSHLSFTNDHSDSSLNFPSRLQSNSSGNSNNLANKLTPSSLSWQDQINHPNGLMPRLPPLHGMSTQLPPFTTSGQSPYGVMSSLHPGGLGGLNQSNITGQDSDNLAKLNAMRSSPGQSNPMQFRDEKSFPMSFPTLHSSKHNQPNLENLRNLPPNIANPEMIAQERITEDKLAIFAYNLFSVGLPGQQKLKKIVQLDDDMRQCIQNGEFYTKYGQLANGILTNQIIVPNFSIIEYLRRDRFPLQEVEHIERVNRNMSVSNLLCLMELVRQRPQVPGKSGPETGKPSHFVETNPMGLGPGPMNFQADNMPGMIGMHHGSHMKGNAFSSSSPTRMELMGPQGIDKSRRSSQSPSDISRSQMGNSAGNSKLLSAQSMNNNPHQHQSSLSSIGGHHFAPPLYTPNQLQPHTSPQANRSSPFQQPLAVGPQPVARPPRSHSTIGGLGVGAFNSPYSLAMPQVRQPPAAHQSSSRPNLAGLSLDMTTSQSSQTNVPVTAHMSSKTPQTPKLPDSLTRPNLKAPSQPTLPPVVSKINSGRDPMALGQLENQQHQPVRPDLESMHGIPVQTLISLRQQEMMANRELALKRSSTPHFPSGPGSNQNIDLARHHALIDNNPNLPMSHGLMNNQSTPLGSMGGQLYRPPGQGLVFGSSMPPPTSDPQRQFGGDQMNRHMSFPQGPPATMQNDTQLKQYNALMMAYQQQQQQLMMPGKSIDNLPSSVGMQLGPNSAPTQLGASQPVPMRLSIGEPMHVDIQHPRQPQSQTNSPKLTNQRSIITGSGTASASGRKSKKAKPSPTSNAQANEPKSTTIAPIADQATQKEPSLDAHAQQTSTGSMKSDTEVPISFSVERDPALAMHLNADVQKSATELPAATNNNPVQDGTPTGGASLAPQRDTRSSSTEASDKTCENSSMAPACPSINTTDANASATADQNIAQADGNLNSSTKDNSLAGDNKQSDINKTNLQSNSSLDQPSKYQKLFTKKAWLKNYDLEDQARTVDEVVTQEDKMAVSVKEKIEDADKSTVNETKTKEEKSSNLSTKSNGGAKKSASTKPDSKKRVKDGKTKKANSVAAIRSNRASVKGTDNDSEGTNASTSDLDDTDETDSMKSSSNKKLRRMPRRKVKSNPDREASEHSNVSAKPKVSKDSKDRDVVSRKRVKKEKLSSASPDLSSPAKRKYNSDDESVKQKTKKIKESTDKDSSPNSKNKKRAGEKFLQTQPCYEIVPKSIRCLECRRVRQSSLKGDKVVQSKQASKTNWDDFCRFFEFRKLRYNKSAQIVVAGFSDANDAKESDMKIWLPQETEEVPKNITFRVAKFILSNIGDKFCDLVLQERSVSRTYEAISGDKRTTWKRAVNGLRELCDVCSTTLFNCHYVCDRCGFVVCIDCHEARSKDVKEITDEDETKKDQNETNPNNENNQGESTDQVAVVNKKSKKDRHGWIFCAKNEEHSDDKLSLAKIIAGNCLEEVWTLMHEMRRRLNLGGCSCQRRGLSPLTPRLEQIDGKEMNPSSGVEQEEEGEQSQEGTHSTLKGLLLASSNSGANNPIDVKTEDPFENSSAEIKKETVPSDDKEARIKDRHDDNKVFDFGNEDDSQDDSRQVSAAIEGCIASLAVDGNDDLDGKSRPKLPGLNNMTGLSSSLCDGDLLVLNHPRHNANIQLFRQHWRLGKPVLVRGVHEKMNIDMWLPQFFLAKFGDYRSDLVDCRNGDIHRQSMRKYWDGFEPSSSKKKVKDDALPGYIPNAASEEPSAITTSYYSGSALWRLKDWPPGQDFKEILPEHYDDFMNNLPLKSYTTRTGRLNLACRLPKEMLKPDLGPKMYSAYGTTKFPERGTTNLHLDISDAVNVMVYVGGAMPFSQGSSEYSEIYDNAISDCCVDPMMKQQIREQKLIPGALWHIFRPCDANKIREFLNKVSDECKLSPDKRIDPIHDQIWYLDQNLLDRLKTEHGVKSYPILQCMGDAILIPAGAPHQVKNLQNCIKVANDFVSPENIEYCLKLTDEFRKLPETHINQEDKLQIKNIVYHSVKESIQYIKMFESGKVSQSDESSDEDDLDDENVGSLTTNPPLASTN